MIVSALDAPVSDRKPDEKTESATPARRAASTT